MSQFDDNITSVGHLPLGVDWGFHNLSQYFTTLTVVLRRTVVVLEAYKPHGLLGVVYFRLSIAMEMDEFIR